MVSFLLHCLVGKIHLYMLTNRLCLIKIFLAYKVLMLLIIIAVAVMVKQHAMAMLQLVNAQKTGYMQVVMLYVWDLLHLLTVFHQILARLNQLHTAQVLQVILVMEQNPVVFAQI